MGTDVGTIYRVVAGWTGNIDIDLRDNGAIPVGTLGGVIDLILKDQNGNGHDFSGEVSVLDALNWRIRVSPASTDFVPGVYRGRVKVTDNYGKVAYFPNGVWDRWIVYTETY